LRRRGAARFFKIVFRMCLPARSLTVAKRTLPLAQHLKALPLQRGNL